MYSTCDLYRMVRKYGNHSLYFLKGKTCIFDRTDKIKIQHHPHFIGTPVKDKKTIYMWMIAKNKTKNMYFYLSTFLQGLTFNWIHVISAEDFHIRKDLFQALRYLNNYYKINISGVTIFFDRVYFCLCSGVLLCSSLLITCI